MLLLIFTSVWVLILKKQTRISVVQYLFLMVLVKQKLYWYFALLIKKQKQKPLVLTLLAWMNM